MRRLGYALLLIGVSMISFGLGWMIGIPIKNLYMKEVCNNTKDIEWYVENNCMRYCGG